MLWYRPSWAVEMKQLPSFLNLFDLVSNYLDVKILDLLLHRQHQVEPINVRVAGVVFDDAARGRLAAELVSDDEGLHLVPSRVQRRPKSRSPLPDYHHVVRVFVIGHDFCSRMSSL